MSQERKCVGCGAELPDDAPKGLCPRCLLQGGMDGASGSSTEATVTAQAVAGSTPPLRTVQYVGDYELLEEIARGGMGIVYKARQRTLNRIVAVKMILSGQLASEADVRRFHTEAEAAANLQHPNIVAIHEVGLHERQHYFSMDFVAGGSLSELVRERPVEPGKAAQLVKTIAEAIQYAHQRGILHRDLKPRNVLLDERGQPRITDFGLAKLIRVDGGLTHTGAIMGSPSYMPPEQASGRQDQVGPASDVYSMGAVLYELLTGRPPFRGETPMATLAKVLDDEAKLPRSLEPKVPADLETVCLKCLEKKTERRYATARALAEDLERFLNGEPVLARPASAWRKAWIWSKRRPWLLMLAMTVAMVALLGAVFWLQTENRFLRWTASRPGYVKMVGPISKGFESLLNSMAFMGATWMGLMYGYLILGFLVRRRIPAAWTARSLVGLIGICLGLGLAPMVFGILFLRQGILAHIWEGAPLGKFMLMAFVLMYACIVSVWEFIPGVLRVVRSPEVIAKQEAQNRELVKAAIMDLRKGSWRSFLARGMPQFYGMAGSAVNECSGPAFNRSPFRMALVLASVAAAFWVGSRFGREYKSMAAVGWICGLNAVLSGSASLKAMRIAGSSRRRILLHQMNLLGIYFIFTPLLFGATFLFDIGEEAMKIFVPWGLSVVLGVTAGLACVGRDQRGQHRHPVEVSAIGMGRQRTSFPGRDE